MNRSPTPRLLIGLAFTLLVSAAFCWYSLRQIDDMRGLQTGIVDRNRKDSLQLLRIQNNLNALGLGIRDIMDRAEPYPLSAWRGEFDRIRHDLSDAIAADAKLSSRPAEQQRHLRTLLDQLWSSLDQTFTIAAAGEETRARAMIANSVQAQQSAVSATVARLLVQNHESEDAAIAEIQQRYDRVEHNVYVFFAAMMLSIAAIGLYVAHSNRRLFTELAGVSEQRQTLARRLIGMQERIFGSVSRELHDDFGQILTAIGAMLNRAERKGIPPGSPLRADLAEVREVVQEALEKTRSFSQALHPTVLDDYGLEQALERYVQSVERQIGIKVAYEKEGSAPVPEEKAIHIYRILQEALTNVARHSRSTMARVRVRFLDGRFHMEVEDRGVGIRPGSGAAGLGLIAMRERAELMQARLSLMSPSEGGTLLTLDVPLNGEAG